MTHTVDDPGVPGRRRAVVVAGHSGDALTALTALRDLDPSVRDVALGAADRWGVLSDELLIAALTDPDPGVRRRAVELAAARSHISLLAALHDDESAVVETAAWACGEHERVDDEVMDRLVVLASADAPLVREAAVAALGAIGDERGLAAVIQACADLPAVRRRAVLALAPFDGVEVDAAIERALVDRDWQVRQAAEDLTRAMRD